MKYFNIFILLSAITIISCEDESSHSATGIQLSETSLTIRESSAEPSQVKVTLNEFPDSNVTITVHADDPSQVRFKPESGTISAQNQEQGLSFFISCVDDKTHDGDKEVSVTFLASSDDAEMANTPAATLKVTCVDDGQIESTTDKGTRLRLMAANITSGTNQTYDNGQGIRIFQALKPDIVMIQEFNYTKGTIDDFVHTTFGENYHYYRGTVADGYTASGIPNGIISSYEIIESGQWAPVYRKSSGEEKPAYEDRLYAWAVIDIPGDRDLLAVSVHLHTDNHGLEMSPLTEKIAAKQKEGNYYVVLGGDFNTKDSGNMRSTVLDNALMSSFFVTSGPYPVDQKGNEATNRKRAAPLDWVLLDTALDIHEIPITIGTHTYPNGHVFDSRVYDELGEIGDVQPVQAGDSDALNMQHMAVIRDVEIPY